MMKPVIDDALRICVPSDRADHVRLGLTWAQAAS
jgi:hypothetical protein